LLSYIESRRAAMGDKRLEIPQGLNHRLQKLERELRAGADSSAAGAAPWGPESGGAGLYALGYVMV
jgi:hypothetical protein